MICIIYQVVPGTCRGGSFEKQRAYRKSCPKIGMFKFAAAMVVGAQVKCQRISDMNPKPGGPGRLRDWCCGLAQDF